MTIKEFFSNPSRVMLTIIGLVFLGSFFTITYLTLFGHFIAALFYIPLLGVVFMLLTPFFPLQYNKWGNGNVVKGYKAAFKILGKIYLLSDDELDIWFKENYRKL